MTVVNPVTNAPGAALVQAVSGVSLINGTQTFLTYNAPSDGKFHHCYIFAGVQTSTTQTGGDISITVSGTTTTALAGGQTGPAWHPLACATGQMLTVPPGASVTVSQTVALTAGAATFSGEIWGA